MKYLILPNYESAQEISANIAAMHGAGDNQGDETKYWYGIRKHPTTAACALEIADDGDGLTQFQRDSLVDDLPADWTPQVEPNM